MKKIEMKKQNDEIVRKKLDKIKKANDIVSVIGRFLKLEKAGANFITLCPFHREKTPSFSVNPTQQIYYCFGCHKGGDIFRFIMEYENVSATLAYFMLHLRTQHIDIYDELLGWKKSSVKKYHSRITEIMKEFVGES